MNIGQCGICLGGFSIATMGVLSTCMHTFHHACIERALRLRGECPMCRCQSTLTQLVRPPEDQRSGAAVKIASDLPKKVMEGREREKCSENWKISISRSQKFRFLSKQNCNFPSLTCRSGSNYGMVRENLSVDNLRIIVI